VVEVTVEGGRFVFEVLGIDKLWSLRSRLEIPIEHIKQASVDPNPAMGWFDGLRLAGTAVPHIFRAGIFYQKGKLVFWDVSHPENTIAIDLDHEHFDRLIIEVADPEAVVKLIRNTKAKNR
jgi:hypothetical protein